MTNRSASQDISNIDYGAVYDGEIIEVDGKVLQNGNGKQTWSDGSTF